MLTPYIVGLSLTVTPLLGGISGDAAALLKLFFFSSRRRHTRLQGDWSSDVCSSDLERSRITGIVALENLLARVDELVVIRDLIAVRRGRDLIDRIGRVVCEPRAQARSEEHTSELQSPCNLVCRLLLEKKKK